MSITPSDGMSPRSGRSIHSVAPYDQRTHRLAPRLGTHDATRRQKVAPAPKPGEKKKARNSGRGAGRPEPVELVASPADAQLLERLRALRTRISKEEQVPAYVVIPDPTLLEIAVRRPKSPYALGEIRGVGPAKIDKYGERFLELVRTSDETEAA